MTLEDSCSISPYREIEIFFDILDFTDAFADPYERKFSHGIPLHKDDNSEFYMNNSHQHMNRRELVGAIFNSYIDDGHAEHILYAPTTAENYTLVVTALTAMNNTLRGETITKLMHPILLVLTKKDYQLYLKVQTSSYQLRILQVMKE